MLSVVGERYFSGLQKLFNSNSKLDMQSRKHSVITKVSDFHIIIFTVLLLIDGYMSDLMYRITLGSRHNTNDCLQNTRV